MRHELGLLLMFLLGTMGMLRGTACSVEEPDGQQQAPEMRQPTVRPAEPSAEQPGIATRDGYDIEWLFSRPAGIEFTKAEITVAQYQACVQAGQCKIPARGGSCNAGKQDREHHPINCIDWNQATAFCAWAGGRLPTEQEWYAEASNGGERLYAWGDQQASCEWAVMNDGTAPEGTGAVGDGCGLDSTWPVCSKPQGHSVSGLCDMSGNVWEWTASSQVGNRVICGGGYMFDPGGLRATDRTLLPSISWTSLLGFRCARPAR